jgi:hypothetical protein
LHVGGASTNQRRAEMEARLYASILAFYRRHYSRWQMLQLSLILWGMILAKLMRDRVQLGRTRDPLKRSRLSENVSIWAAVLSQLSQRGQESPTHG